MKKILSLALGATLVASLAVSASAAAMNGANAKTVKAEVKAAAETPVMDGKIGEYEYAKINTPVADLVISDEKAKDVGFDLYLAYDKDYLYYAIKTTHEAHKNENDKDMTTIWNSDGIQVSGAKAKPASATDRGEIGYALSSTSGKVLYNTWADALKSGFKASADDVKIVIDGKTAIYEGKVPAKFFGEDALEKGDSFKASFMVNTLIGGTRYYVEWGTGVGSTKDANAHATITLGDAIVLPKKEAPKTADATSVAVLALAASLAAGYVVAKKH
jgi:hypothetical protein